MCSPPLLMIFHRRATLDHYLMPAHYVLPVPTVSPPCLSMCLVFRHRASAPLFLRGRAHHPSHTPFHSVSPLLLQPHQARAVMQCSSMHHLRSLLIVHTTSLWQSL